VSTKKPIEKSTALVPITSVKLTTVGEFVAGGRTCEMISVHGTSESEDKFSTQEMVRRGNSGNKIAHMNKENGLFLFHHKRDIPTTADYTKFTFLFPLWTIGDNGKKDEQVRLINFNGDGVTWWCLLAVPDIWDWDKNHVLVRFHKA
jgi:hypothetical protein